MDFKLEKWDTAFIDDVAKCANNLEIAKWLRDVFPYPYTLQDAAQYVTMCAENDEQAQLCRAITVDGHAVGSIGVFVQNDVYSKSAELGYWLAQEYWGNGIMSSAVKTICKQAFLKFDIVRIYAEPFAENKKSCKVLQNAGFLLEGCMKNAVCKNGKLMDYNMYALLK